MALADEYYGTLDAIKARFGEAGIHMPAPDPIRARVLDDAKEAVCNDRNAEYGEPIDNLGRWAGACNALGYQGPGGRTLKPHDLAVIMGLGKLARTVQTPDKADHWVDLAGYAAVGFELVTLEDQ
jgi:hypothetical protein